MVSVETIVLVEATWDKPLTDLLVSWEDHANVSISLSFPSPISPDISILGRCCSESIHPARSQKPVSAVPWILKLLSPVTAYNLTVTSML